MPRYLGRHQISYSQRSYRKVRAEDIVEDGEIKGLKVARGEEDQEHPQKFLRPPGPDRMALFRPVPESKSEPVTIHVGYESGTDFIERPQGIQQLHLQLGNGRLQFDTETPNIGYSMGGYSNEGYSGYTIETNGVDVII